MYGVYKRSCHKVKAFLREKHITTLNLLSLSQPWACLSTLNLPCSSKSKCLGMNFSCGGLHVRTVRDFWDFRPELLLYSPLQRPAGGAQQCCAAPTLCGTSELPHEVSKACLRTSFGGLSPTLPIIDPNPTPHTPDPKQGPNKRLTIFS